MDKDYCRGTRSWLQSQIIDATIKKNTATKRRKIISHSVSFYQHGIQSEAKAARHKFKTCKTSCTISQSWCPGMDTSKHTGELPPIGNWTHSQSKSIYVHLKVNKHSSTSATPMHQPQTQHGIIVYPVYTPVLQNFNNNSQSYDHSPGQSMTMVTPTLQQMILRKCRPFVSPCLVGVCCHWPSVDKMWSPRMRQRKETSAYLQDP